MSLFLLSATVVQLLLSRLVEVTKRQGMVPNKERDIWFQNKKQPFGWDF